MPTYIEAGKAHDARYERLFAPWNEVDRDLDCIECYGCNHYVPRGTMERGARGCSRVYGGRGLLLAPPPRHSCSIQQPIVRQTQMINRQAHTEGGVAYRN